jgi:hypothetical protein
MPPSLRRRPSLLPAFCLLLFLLPAVRAAVDPVTFVFRLPPDARNPFTRILWAEVVTPGYETIRLPVFFAGDGQFAVRARAGEKGEYRLGKVTENFRGQITILTPDMVSRDRQRIREVEELPAVRCAAGQPARLELADGTVYTPIGANLAWADQDRVAFHLRALAAFGRAGLNWTRIWMVHWSGLNLDWLPDDMGKSPPPGFLDLRVAADWDKIVAQAEKKGVYLQIVLQHHGQYSSVADSSWPQHPWNAANPGGFLASPAEFYTSPIAKGLTALKYRYIVARWGYSPAVLAWELFNEVHWTDAIERNHDEAAVARWHSEMAAYLRSVDRYHHLVTTSTDNLRSPIYADMDYFQPHLYPSNILAGVRFFDPPPDQLDRPVFCGEYGDNHMPLTPEQKASGVAIVPPVWASLMGQGRYPAQPWVGEQLIKQGRLNELGAVARFLAATGLGGREGLTPFSPIVECPTRIPLVLGAGQVWQRRPDPEITVPLDGREPPAFADIPQILVGSPSTSVYSFPGRVTYHFDLPRPVTVRLQVADTGAAGAAIRVMLDGQVVAAHSWPPHPAQAGGTAPTALELPFPAEAGTHTLVVDNPGGPDWVGVAGIDFGLDIPVLAAVGKRGRDFLAVWVWHRTGVLALTPPPAVGGTLVLEDVPAGTWHATWWDSLKGVPAAPVPIRHPGGTLRLPTPPIRRHAAVTLTR